MPACVDECREIAAVHLYWLRHHVPADDPRIREADQRLAAWTHLKWAWWYVESNWMDESPNRLELIACELEGLYRLIGPENYRAGRMPDPIPCRRIMNPVVRNKP